MIFLLVMWIYILLLQSKTIKIRLSVSPNQTQTVKAFFYASIRFKSLPFRPLK